MLPIVFYFIFCSASAQYYRTLMNPTIADNTFHIDCGNDTDGERIMRIMFRGDALSIYAAHDPDACVGEEVENAHFQITNAMTKEGCMHHVHKLPGMMVYFMEIVVERFNVRHYDDSVYVITCNYELGGTGQSLPKAVWEGAIMKVPELMNVGGLSDIDVSLEVMGTRSNTPLERIKLGSYIQLFANVSNGDGDGGGGGDNVGYIALDPDMAPDATPNLFETMVENFDECFNTCEAMANCIYFVYAGEMCYGFHADVVIQEHGIQGYMITSRSINSDGYTFKMWNCRVYTAQDQYYLMVAGCGDGDVVKKNRGWLSSYDDGQASAKSVFFRAFRLPASETLTFECNFIVCLNDSCVGRSCPQPVRKRRSNDAMVHSDDLNMVVPYNREDILFNTGLPVTVSTTIHILPATDNTKYSGTGTDDVFNEYDLEVVQPGEDESAGVKSAYRRDGVAIGVGISLAVLVLALVGLAVCIAGIRKTRDNNQPKICKQ